MKKVWALLGISFGSIKSYCRIALDKESHFHK